MKCICCNSVFKRTKEELLINEASEYLCNVCLNESESEQDNSKVEYRNPFDITDLDIDLQLLLNPTGRTIPKGSGA